MTKWSLSLKNMFGLSFETVQNRMIISTDTEKTFDKIEHPFMTKQIKTSQKTRNIKNLLNLIKVIDKNIKL